jgi:AcrR family transcriptional regulator
LTGANETGYCSGVPSPSITDPDSPALNARVAQRLQTRAQLFEAALAEIGRRGLAGADVAAIAANAGVSRGTFYFHFPTKAHVLVELERAEEVEMVANLDPTTVGSDDLMSVLRLLVRHVIAAEERIGPAVFQDMLGLHFSATRPAEDELVEHPLAEFVIAAIAKAQATQRISPDADPSQLALIFLTGLFALLATGASASEAGAALLDQYVKTVVQGMEAR